MTKPSRKRWDIPHRWWVYEFADGHVEAATGGVGEHATWAWTEKEWIGRPTVRHVSVKAITREEAIAEARLKWAKRQARTLPNVRVIVWPKTDSCRAWVVGHMPHDGGPASGIPVSGVGLPYHMQVLRALFKEGVDYRVEHEVLKDQGHAHYKPKTCQHITGWKSDPVKGRQPRLCGQPATDLLEDAQYTNGMPMTFCAFHAKQLRAEQQRRMGLMNKIASRRGDRPRLTR